MSEPTPGHQAILIRFFLLVYALGTSGVCLIALRRSAIAQWATARGLVPGEVYRLILTVLLAVSIGSLVAFSLTAWGVLEVRMSNAMISPGAARLRAYGFVPLIVALASLVLYFAYQ